MRREHGDDMVRLFTDQLRAAQGWRGRWMLWALALTDLVRHAGAERLRQIRQSANSTAHDERNPRWPALSGLWQDARYAIRWHRRAPGASLIALAALALGIGANTAIFSFADALLLRPLPVGDPDRLVALLHVATPGGTNYSSFSIPDYLDLRDGPDALSGLAAHADLQLDLGGLPPQRVESEIVSGNYFEVLGVAPAVGRLFTRDDDREGASAPVVVLSHRLWQRRFGGTPDVVGRSLDVNGRPFTIIGVTPAELIGLDLGASPELWVTLAMHPIALPAFRMDGVELYANRGTHWVDLVGRLSPGVAIDQAGAALRALAARQAADNPETNAAWSIAVMPAHEARLGPPGSRPLLQLTALLTAVVGLVLIIACANVANLLLARALSRRREVGLRLAIGAGRGRLVRQFLTEAVVLSVAGGLAGILLAALCLRSMALIDVTRSLPDLGVRIDLRVLGFALTLATLTGLAFGLVPALQTTSVDLQDSLRPYGSGHASVSRRWSPRQAFVVVQVALSLLLLVGAGLTLGTIRRLYAIPLGFDPNHLWVASVEMSQAGFSAERGQQVLEDVVERVGSLPGVEAVDIARITPFDGNRMANDVFWTRGNESGQRRRTNIDMNVVGRNYFKTMRIPLERGRAFDAADRTGAPDVVIVNRVLADKLWPGEDAIGKVLWSWNSRGSDRPMTVVGVAADGRYYRSWRTSGRPFAFVPFDQWFMGTMFLHVRTADGAVLGEADLRRQVAAAGPGLPPVSPLQVADSMGASIALERTAANLFAAFGALALAIAGIGIYGVVSFTVGERTRELGLRMALGAPRARVLRGVILASLRPVLVGVAIGWLAGFAVTPLMAGVIFGVRPTDPTTFAAVAVLLVTIGLVASVGPAHRATRVDPLTSLRSE
jgi:predicted permease